MVRKVLTVVMIVSLLGLAVWQYQIITRSDTSIKRGTAVEDLSFELLDGSTVTIPEKDSKKFSVLIFWSSQSERSLELLNEAVELAAKPEADSALQFYFITLEADRDQVADAVDTQRLAPYLGFNPSGSYMEDLDIRVVPLTVVYSTEGEMIDLIEGYDKGHLEKRAETWMRAFAASGGRGGLKFTF